MNDLIPLAKLIGGTITDTCEPDELTVAMPDGTQYKITGFENAKGGCIGVEKILEKTGGPWQRKVIPLI